jgi:hypothetical protein
VLRLDSESAWEILAADALELEQQGKDVQILESPVTRLLFDDALLVGSAPGAKVLAFQDYSDAPVAAGGTTSRQLVRQGRWQIVKLDAERAARRTSLADTDGRP